MTLPKVAGGKSVDERLLRLERLIDGRLTLDNLNLSKILGGSIIQGPEGFVARKDQRLVLIWDYKFPRVVRSCQDTDGEYDYCIVIKEGHKFILVNQADTQGEVCISSGSLEITVADAPIVNAPNGAMTLQSNGEDTFIIEEDMVDFAYPETAPDSTGASLGNTPTEVAGAQVGWLHVKVDGTDRFIPLWGYA